MLQVHAVLLRRCYWLSGNTELLTNELAWQINHPDSKYYNLELDNLAFEMDRHVFQSRSFNAKKSKRSLLSDHFQV